MKYRIKCQPQLQFCKADMLVLLGELLKNYAILHTQLRNRHFFPSINFQTKNCIYSLFLDTFLLYLIIHMVIICYRLHYICFINIQDWYVSSGSFTCKVKDLLMPNVGSQLPSHLRGLLFALNMRLWQQISAKRKAYMPQNFECWIKVHSTPVHLEGRSSNIGPETGSLDSFFFSVVSRGRF